MSEQTARIIAYTNIIEYANSKLKEHAQGASSQSLVLIQADILDIERRVDSIRHLTPKLEEEFTDESDTDTAATAL